MRIESADDPILDGILAGVADDLDFLCHLVEQLRGSTIENCELNTLEAAMADVVARRHDRSLYLAVIGEFSSGKTTFINALLGERLLTSSPWANTAAITEIRQGAQLKLSVRFRGEERDAAYPSQELDETLKRLNRRMGTLEEVLSQLTSDEDVGPGVQRVMLEHPSQMLGDEIVVLDTPGINSTNEAHTAAALEIITGQADAFVVLISSQSPVSMLLQGLLTEQLRPFLDRVTFVVTHIDHVDEAERASVVEFVRRRLQNQLGVKSPHITACAPAAALRVRSGDPHANGHDHEWLDAFERLRAELVRRLRMERTATVADRVTRLLRRAMELSESSLQRQETALRERAALLARTAPADLERFCTDEIRDLRSMVAAAALNARMQVEKANAAALLSATVAIRTHVQNATNQTELTAALKAVPTTIEQNMETVTKAAVQAGELLACRTNEAARKLDRDFESRWAGLHPLTDSLFRANSRFLPKVAASDVAADALALREKLDSRGVGGAFGAAGLGATIGTIVFPGIGTLIGAGLGGIFGGVAKGTNLEKRREQYWDELEPNVQAAFKNLLAGHRKAIERQADAAKSHLECRVAAYRDLYAHAIRELHLTHRATEKELRRQLAETRRHAARVTARIQLLRQTTERLTRMNAEQAMSARP